MKRAEEENPPSRLLANGEQPSRKPETLPTFVDREQELNPKLLV